jgi:hypothetical protein
MIAIACGGDSTAPGPPVIANDTPEAAALSLFALAVRPHDDGDASARTVVDPSLLSEDPGALYDALDALRGVEGPRVVAAERLEGLDRWAVDLEGALPGPALANFSAQVEPADDGTWSVVWFAGPGVEWPRREPPRGDGLASSEPPATD